RFPDGALVLNRQVGMRVRPGQRLDRGVDGENLGGVVAAPAMMRRGGADRGDGDEDASSSTDIHDETSEVRRSSILPGSVTTSGPFLKVGLRGFQYWCTAP